MGKRLILILALAFLVGITCAAYAEVQNVKVSGDLTVKGLSRKNIMLRDNDLDPLENTEFLEYNHKINVLLSNVRVRLDADLTDNVSATVRLINERVWGEEAAGANTGSTSSTDVDLDLAYATLKEFLYSPLTLTVGRQELMFGNGFIIGDVDTNGIMAGHGITAGSRGAILPRSLDDLTLRKAFDAIKATLNYDPLVVDVVYAKVDEELVDDNDDADLYGLNANYSLDKNTTLEAYYWEKRRAKAFGTASAPTNLSTSERTSTFGGRAHYTGVKNLSVGVEGAYQTGRYIRSTILHPDEKVNDGASRRRSAYAIQAISQYNLSDLIKKYEPVLGLSYTYLSGDPWRSTNKRYKGWDPMFENQAGGTLFNKILGYSNAQLANLSISLKPMEDVKLALDYYYLRLNKAYKEDGGVLPNTVNLTGVVGDPTYKMKPGHKSLGNEIDATLTYDYTEDVQLGLSMGWFLPGGAFAPPNTEDATQVVGSMKVTF